MEPFVGRRQWRRNVTWSSVTLSMPWPAPPFALACPDSKAKCAALSEPSAADRCNEPETETAEALSSVLLGCDAHPCTCLDVNCNLGFVAGLAAAHGANAECFETYPLRACSQAPPPIALCRVARSTAAPRTPQTARLASRRRLPRRRVRKPQP